MIFQYDVAIERNYKRRDFVGTLTRHIFEEPKLIQTFDKSHGISRLVEKRLKPRINLRWMASYRTIFMISFALIFGKLLFGGSFFGFFLLILFKLLIIFVLAAYEFLFK